MKSPLSVPVLIATPVLSSQLPFTAHAEDIKQGDNVESIR